MTRKIGPGTGAALALAATTALLACGPPRETVAIHYPAASPRLGAVTRAPGLPEPDRDFVRQATGANLAAIRLGQLAIDRGTSPLVKDIGRELIDSHTVIDDRLRATAREEQDGLSSARMTARQEEAYQRLSRLSGPEFDRAFLAAILDEQQHAVNSFNREASGGRDRAIRALAHDTLPLLNDRVRYVKIEMETL
jgi:putative membrane protein